MFKSVFHGWWLVFVAFVAQMVGTGSVIYIYSIIAAPFAAEFGANRLTMSLGATGLTLAAGLLSPLLGVAIDKGSIRTFMAGGAIALALGYLALSMVTDMWHIPVIYVVLISFGYVLLGPLSGSTLLARWFLRRRGLVLGIAAMGTSAGGFVFPPLAQFLVGEFGWRTTCQLLSLLILLLTLPPILLLVVNRPADRRLFPDGATAAPADSGGAQTHFGSTLGVLRDRNFWLVGIAMGILFAISSTILSNMVMIATDIGIPQQQAVLGISLLSACGLLGKFLFGYIGDRIDLRLGFSGVIVLFIIALICFTIALGGNSKLWLVLLGCLLLGLAGGGALPMWGALLAKLFGAENYGRVMGLMSLVTTSIIVLAMPITGHIRDVAASYQVAFAAFIVAAGLTLLLMPLLRMPRAVSA